MPELEGLMMLIAGWMWIIENGPYLVGAGGAALALVLTVRRLKRGRE